MGFLCFLKKEQKPISFQKSKKVRIKTNNKTQVG